MILDQQEANRVVPLIANIDAYEALQHLIDALKKRYYNELIYENNENARGALILLDELKDLRARLKDSLKNGR